MKTKICSLFVVLMMCGCGHKNPVPNRAALILKAQVSQYTDLTYRKAFLDKSMQLNFVSPSKDDLKANGIGQIISQNCSAAAANKGYKVSFEDTSCKDCVDVIPSGVPPQSVDQTSKNPPFVQCLFDENQVGQNCFSSATKNSRWMGLNFVNHETKKSVHQIEVTSEGAADSVAKVAAEMCFAAFSDFPDAMIKKNYTVPYPLTDKSR